MIASEEYLREVTIGDLKPLNGTVFVFSAGCGEAGRAPSLRGCETRARRAHVEAPAALRRREDVCRYLLDAPDGPIMIYAMEAPDHERAAKAFVESKLAIDAEHKAVLRQVLGGPVSCELLFECHADK